MKVDPFAPQLLIDYSYFCDRFGPLPFGDFIAMWHAADALMQAAAAGFEPHAVRWRTMARGRLGKRSSQPLDT